MLVKVKADYLIYIFLTLPSKLDFGAWNNKTKPF